MVSQTFTITNSQGFHMRPAGTFTSAMGKYQSTVTIVKDGNIISPLKRKSRRIIINNSPANVLN